MRLGTRELARALSAEGNQISAAGISRAFRSGRICRGEDGKYDLDEVRSQLTANTNAVKAKAGRAQQRKQEVREEAPDGTATGETLSQAQTRKEIALANLRELEEAEKRKSLLPTEEVRDAVNGMVMAFRSKALVIGDELADKLAATSDPIACREMVDERVHQALSELAEYPQDAA